MTLDDWQAEIGTWQRETFPGGTPDGVLAHLIREVRELVEDRTADEAADCLILLVAYADRMGFSLQDAVAKKHSINLKRTWGEPDADGVIEHVETGVTRW